MNYSIKKLRREAVEYFHQREESMKVDYLLLQDLDQQEIVVHNFITWLQIKNKKEAV